MKHEFKGTALGAVVVAAILAGSSSAVAAPFVLPPFVSLNYSASIDKDDGTSDFEHGQQFGNPNTTAVGDLKSPSISSYLYETESTGTISHGGKASVTAVQAGTYNVDANSTVSYWLRPIQLCRSIRCPPVLRVPVSVHAIGSARSISDNDDYYAFSQVTLGNEQVGVAFAIGKDDTDSFDSTKTYFLTVGQQYQVELETTVHLGDNHSVDHGFKYLYTSGFGSAVADPTFTVDPAFGDIGLEFSRGVFSVPEPGVWLTMILGFGLVGMRTRRQYRLNAVAG